MNGTTLHYMRGGEGPTVLLIHGFPQDWYEWRHVMPRLAPRFSVVAVDLRGVGGSAAPATGYDAAAWPPTSPSSSTGSASARCTWSATTSAGGWRTRWPGCDPSSSAP